MRFWGGPAAHPKTSPYQRASAVVMRLLSRLQHGQHTQEVLLELGYTTEDVDAARDAGWAR